MKKRLTLAILSIVAVAVLLPGVSASAQEPGAYRSTARADRQSAYGSDEWHYNTYYIFPLVRHMSDSELPQYGQYLCYPLAAALDIAQFPAGVLGGLLGE